MPQQLAPRLEPVLSHYVRPSVRAAQKGSCPFLGSIFLYSHTAFICHTMKYRSICWNLSCQSRRGSKSSLASSQLAAWLVSKVFEVTPSQFPMSRLSHCTELQTPLVQWVLFQTTPCQVDLDKLETVVDVGD